MTGPLDTGLPVGTVTVTSTRQTARHTIGLHAERRGTTTAGIICAIADFAGLIHTLLTARAIAIAPTPNASVGATIGRAHRGRAPTARVIRRVAHPTCSIDAHAVVAVTVTAIATGHAPRLTILGRAEWRVKRTTRIIGDITHHANAVYALTRVGLRAIVIGHTRAAYRAVRPHHAVAAIVLAAHVRVYVARTTLASTAHRLVRVGTLKIRTTRTTSRPLIGLVANWRIRATPNIREQLAHTALPIGTHRKRRV